jgi:2,3-bisphosphoglycerate-dependent phosphoglycerate mutase
MTSVRHLVLVRHGQSQLNEVNRHTRVFCGQYDTPLTELGRAQAQEAGRLLANHPEVRLQAAVSSCRQRAGATLALIVEALPYSVEVLPADGAFNERSLGVFENCAEADVFRDYPHYRDDERFNRFQNDLLQKAPGGENLAEVRQRAWPALQRLLDSVAGDLLVVSHYNTIRCLLWQALDLSPQQVLDLRIPNTAPIVLRYDGALALFEGTVSNSG